MTPYGEDLNVRSSTYIIVGTLLPRKFKHWSYCSSSMCKLIDYSISSYNRINSAYVISYKG